MSNESQPDETEQDQLTFQQVLAQEEAVINKDKTEPIKSFETIGLALSGGGIRSATFNLGVIQGLAKQNVLHRFDYLSTVSGGGYIGGWLSALINREGEGNVKKIEAIIAKSTDETAEKSVYVKYLRNYSNYLTPETGFFSTDTLSVVATYIRNLILNQSILILTLAILLLLPRLIHSLNLDNIDITFWLSLISLGFAIFFISSNLAFSNTQVKWHAFNTFEVVVFIALPLILSGTLISHLLSLISSKGQLNQIISSFGYGDSQLLIIPFVGLIYLIIWGVAGILFMIFSMGDQDQDQGIISVFKQKSLGLIDIFDLKSIAVHVLSTFIAGCLAGALFLGFYKLIAAHNIENITNWFVIVFGPPIVIGIFSLTVVYHIGLVGRFFSDKQHEWWARLGAPLIASMIIWTLLFGIAVFAPAIVSWVENRYVMPTLTLGWLLSTAVAVVSAKNDSIKQELNTTRLKFITNAGPYIFIFGLLFFVSYSIQFLSKIDAPISLLSCGNKVSNTVCFKNILSHELRQMSSEDSHVIYWFLCASVVTIILAWRVNINLFSLHHFYRNRLTRAYLGASNIKRSPHPFTGFDESDDLPIQDLKQRPYHIINTAANFTHGQNIGYQDRKADSFIFSPCCCGYTDVNDKGKQNHYYVKTENYGTHTHGEHQNGFLLGSAISLSGAAANSMMGYHTSPGLAFLLAIFNVRLGRWCGNTKPDKSSFKIIPSYKKSDPAFGYFYLISELLGYASIGRGFIQLSDGGHFENTGLYELVRRGCKHIVVCDAGADLNYSFEDLANAIRKCRADFGVEISINMENLRLSNKEHKFSKEHYAVGEIKYGNYLEKIGGKKDVIGTLIVLKPSLTDNKAFPMSTDLLHYARANKQFPQQTTVDQWFDDAQFESYRTLGNHVVEAMFKGLSAQKIGEYGLTPE